MAAFVGQQIIDGAYTYTYAVTKRPDLKAGIDQYLKDNGHEDLIVMV